MKYHQAKQPTDKVEVRQIMHVPQKSSQNYTIDISPHAIIEKDELFMIKYLLGVELSVRCGKSETEFFNTDMTIPQGDGLSAKKFTLYPAKTLHQEKHNDHIYHSCTCKTAM